MTTSAYGNEHGSERLAEYLVISTPEEGQEISAAKHTLETRCCLVNKIWFSILKPMWGETRDSERDPTKGDMNIIGLLINEGLKVGILPLIYQPTVRLSVGQGNRVQALEFIGEKLEIPLARWVGYSTDARDSAIHMKIEIFILHAAPAGGDCHV